MKSISYVGLVAGVMGILALLVPTHMAMAWNETEGCSPGYWKNNGDKNPRIGEIEGIYLKDALFAITGVVVPIVPDDLTLGQAVQLNGGGANAFMRHAAAAVFNIWYGFDDEKGVPLIDYLEPETTFTQIIQDAVNSGDYEAAKDLLDAANNLGCPIDAHGNPIEVPGRIVVNHDEWTLSDTGFANNPDAANFARNVAEFFTDGKGEGNFLAYYDESFLTKSSLASTMTAEGYSWTVVSTPTDFTVEDLKAYDAIFIEGPLVPNNQVLIEYVESGGNVYLAGGTGRIGGGAADEAAAWNTFLNHFNLNFSTSYNDIGPQSISSTHEIFENVSSLYFDDGNSINKLNPSDPNTEIILSADGQGLIAVFEPADS